MDNLEEAHNEEERKDMLEPQHISLDEEQALKPNLDEEAGTEANAEISEDAGKFLQRKREAENLLPEAETNLNNNTKGEGKILIKIKLNSF
jgi:hypothetical protein